MTDEFQSIRFCNHMILFKKFVWIPTNQNFWNKVFCVPKYYYHKLVEIVDLPEEKKESNQVIFMLKGIQNGKRISRLKF